ncbi:MAG: hypothetical protein HRU34_07000 [Richelia sp.]|nr:hypothetical protein [Richelia sp.]CDN16864.1 hypothetical protein RintRC_1831 [Richelia intracellularis]
MTKFSTISQWFQTLIHPPVMQRPNFDCKRSLHQLFLVVAIIKFNYTQ